MSGDPEPRVRLQIILSACNTAITELSYPFTGTTQSRMHYLLDIEPQKQKNRFRRKFMNNAG